MSPRLFGRTNIVWSLSLRSLLDCDLFVSPRPISPWDKCQRCCGFCCCLVQTVNNTQRHRCSPTETHIFHCEYSSLGEQQTMMATHLPSSCGQFIHLLDLIFITLSRAPSDQTSYCTSVHSFLFIYSSAVVTAWKKVFSCLLRQGQDVNPVCVLTTGLELTDPFKANTITNTLTDAHGTLWPQVAALFPQTDVKCFLLFFVVPRLLPFGFITWISAARRPTPELRSYQTNCHWIMNTRLRLAPRSDPCLKSTEQQSQQAMDSQISDHWECQQAAGPGPGTLFVWFSLIPSFYLAPSSFLHRFGPLDERGRLPVICEVFQVTVEREAVPLARLRSSLITLTLAPLLCLIQRFFILCLTLIALINIFDANACCSNNTEWRALEM